MFRKYSYDYEWDKEYCYSDSHVLINRLGITDNESLSAAEREITSLKLAMAIRKPITRKNSRFRKYAYSS